MNTQELKASIIAAIALLAVVYTCAAIVATVLL
jgi:hypothetical protein